MHFLILLLITTSLLTISITALLFRVIFVKNGKFPQTAIEHNKGMKKKNISCPKHEALKDYKDAQCFNCSRY